MLYDENVFSNTYEMSRKWVSCIVIPYCVENKFEVMWATWEEIRGWWMTWEGIWGGWWGLGGVFKILIISIFKDFQNFNIVFCH